MARGTSKLAWEQERPHVLVVACSDGRLQEVNDRFLAQELGIRQYDRLYLPGGGGALAVSGFEYLRAANVRRECAFLTRTHPIERIVLLFHGPAEDGPPTAMCGDYIRRFPAATIAQLRQRQETDALELVRHRCEWAGPARIQIFRCEVTAAGDLQYVELHAD